jgi:hypothetical protein
MFSAAASLSLERDESLCVCVTSACGAVAALFARRPSRGVVKRVNPAVKRPPPTTTTWVPSAKKPACALCVCEFFLSIDRLLAEEINFLPRPLRHIHIQGRERKETALRRRRRNNFSLRDIGRKSIIPSAFLLDIWRQSPSATAVAPDVFTWTANSHFYFGFLGISS